MSRKHHFVRANLTLALIEQLQADRRYRDAWQLFFVEGVRNFVAAFIASTRWILFCIASGC